MIRTACGSNSSSGLMKQLQGQEHKQGQALHQQQRLPLCVTRLMATAAKAAICLF
jgi:hypothetical protein